MSEIFLIGRPNVGKSYLFNKLTDSQQKIGNFAGVTVDKKSAPLSESDLVITDLPGFYTLKTRSKDENIALKNLESSSPEDLICLVIECLKFKDQLNSLLEIRKWCADNYRPLILCLNMKDEAEKFNIQFNISDISKILGLPVFFVSAKTNEGLADLKSFYKNKTWAPPEPLSENEASLQKKIRSYVQGETKLAIRTQTKLDRFFLAPLWGPLFFFLFTYLLFQSIFTWAEPFMTFMEDMVNFVSGYVTPLFSGQMQSFAENAVFAGFGAFLVFTPQIFILTFILSFLERSGYMTRAILICHQPLSWFGLHGKSFIPLMTGHACAVPAIYATRNIENDWIRKLTIFVIPLTVCSARIPVYALLVKLLIPEETFLFGLLGLQGFAFFMLYFFGIFLALLVSALIFKISKQESPNDNFIVELPPYRWPTPKELILRASQTTWNFIRNAGPIIFVVNAVIWALSFWPSGTGNLRESYLASIGKFLEPIFNPIGLDWIQGVAVLSSFLAREIFVSTLGLLYGLASEDPEEVVNLVEIKNISFASGLSLLFFFAVALQCASTVSVMVREGGRKVAYSALVFYLLFAYFGSLIIYQVLS